MPLLVFSVEKRLRRSIGCTVLPCKLTFDVKAERRIIDRYAREQWDREERHIDGYNFTVPLSS